MTCCCPIHNSNDDKQNYSFRGLINGGTFWNTTCLDLTNVKSLKLTKVDKKTLLYVKLWRLV